MGPIISLSPPFGLRDLTKEYRQEQKGICKVMAKKKLHRSVQL